MAVGKVMAALVDGCWIWPGLQVPLPALKVTVKRVLMFTRNGSLGNDTLWWLL